MQRQSCWKHAFRHPPPPACRGHGVSDQVHKFLSNSAESQISKFQNFLLQNPGVESLPNPEGFTPPFLPSATAHSARHPQNLPGRRLRGPFFRFFEGPFLGPFLGPPFSGPWARKVRPKIIRMRFVCFSGSHFGSHFGPLGHRNHSSCLGTVHFSQKRQVPLLVPFVDPPPISILGEPDPPKGTQAAESEKRGPQMDTRF